VDVDYITTGNPKMSADRAAGIMPPLVKPTRWKSSSYWAALYFYSNKDQRFRVQKSMILLTAFFSQRRFFSGMDYSSVCFSFTALLMMQVCLVHCGYTMQAHEATRARSFLTLPPGTFYGDRPPGNGPRRVIHSPSTAPQLVTFLIPGRPRRI